MEKVKTWIFIVGLLSAAALAMATEPAGVLTWADCVRAAAETNPDLIAALKSRQAARANYNGSFNGYSPTVNFTSSYRDSEAHDQSNQWGAGADATMNLFNPSENASIRSSAASLRQSEANYRVASTNVRNSLRQAFANLLFAQSRVQVSREIRDIRQGNARMVTLKYESGRESKGNMLRAKAELKQAEADWASAIRGLRSSQQELNRQMGGGDVIPASPTIMAIMRGRPQVLMGTKAGIQALNKNGFSIETFGNDGSVLVATGTLTTAPVPALPDMSPLVDQHPQVAVKKASRDISYAGLKSARADFWPFLSAQYSRSFSGDTYFPNDAARWNAAALLSYRLFGGGLTSTYYAVSSAKRSLEKADEDLRSTRNQVRSTLESAWANLANGIDQVAVQVQFLEAAKQRNNESSIRYASGLMSFEDWELAVSDLVNFEKGVIQAERDAVVAEAAWASAQGKLLEDKE